MSELPESRWARWRARGERWWRMVAPGRRAWWGAAMGLALATLLLALWLALAAFAGHGRLIITGGFLLLVLLVGGAALLLNGLLWLLLRLPWPYRMPLAAAVLLFAFSFTGLTPEGNIFLAVIFILTASLSGASVWLLVRGAPAGLTRMHRFIYAGGLLIGFLGLGSILFWVFDAGSPADQQIGAPVGNTDQIALPDPANAGTYSFSTLTYGSGSDRHRTEFGAAADIQTEPVYGRPYVSGWSRLRTQFWGFDATKLPLNGRVWLPAGEGPFPIVLIVHGNHNMALFSDKGYAYLAELFASHGMITVSVDQNFLNGSAYADMLNIGGLERENDARAWLLLEHLRQWREWNEDPASPFAGRVDLTRVGLVGHSRGGEAAAVAAAFNRLPRYPDQATITFDYQFGIRAVAALAPVDGQYQPAGQPTEINDVSYLVLHGQYDGDVTTYAGSDQYTRVSFSDAQSDLFKAGVYIAGANHGQFNTDWGEFDQRPPEGYALNRAPLLDPAGQQRLAQGFLNAFFLSTLGEGRDYRPFFQDVRLGREWLPDTQLRTQYADAATQLVADFSEDVDVTTTTWPGGHITTAGLIDWQEYRLRGKNGLHDNSAVTLGWSAGGGNYTLHLPETGIDVPGTGRLVLAVADARDPAEAVEPLDFTIRLADRAGVQADLPLSHVAPVPLPLVAQLTRLTWMSDLPGSEAILQTMSFSLVDFAAANPAFDPAHLATVSFLFDRSQAGRIILDEIGFR